MMTIPFNLQYGPLNGGAWYGATKTSGAEFRAHVTDSNELTEYYLLKLGEDFGIWDQAHMDNYLELIWEHFYECDVFHKKGEKVALCRWMSWMDCAFRVDRQWHTRLCESRSLRPVPYKHLTLPTTPYV